MTAPAEARRRAERLRSALEAAGHATQISVEVGRVIDSPARRNAAAAAPVRVCREQCDRAGIRAAVVNSGNANAAVGERANLAAER